MTKITRHRIEEFTGGWFIGAFSPTLKWTEDFEVSIKLHLKGEDWPTHYHKVATEYNFVFEGAVQIENQIYTKGDIFVVYPEYVMKPTFLMDCTIMCVKTPSVKGDKYICD
jgi:mannose-6-phosphate isomerase-like protein (cupin superfamily)